MNLSDLDKLKDDVLARYNANPPKIKTPYIPHLTPTQRAFIKVFDRDSYEVALTLPFEISSKYHYDKKKHSNRKSKVSQATAINRLNAYINDLNIYFYGHHYVKQGKRLKILTSLEFKSFWHYHIAIMKPIDCPTQKGQNIADDSSAFETILISKWNTLPGPSERAFVSHRKADNGWATYMTKFGGEIDPYTSRF